MLPAFRLQPLPLVEPARLLGFIEEDPSLLEPGLRAVARDLPVPGAGAALTLDLLAIDARGRIAAVAVSELISGRTVEACLLVRAWLQANLPTLKALSPALQAASGEIRSILIGSHAAPAARAFLSQLTVPRPEVLEAQMFESASGTCVCFRSVAGLEPSAAEVPAAAVAVPASSEENRMSADPLAGLPLSTEEAEEFRKLMSGAGMMEPREDFPPEADAIPAASGSFLEN